MGKSFGVVQWVADTGNRLSIFTQRHDLYDQYEGWCHDLGLTYGRIPSFHRDCETARAESAHPEIRKRFLKEYDGGSGHSARYIHERAVDLFGAHLPCQHGGGCEYIRRLNEFDPEVYDIVVGHFSMARQSVYTADRFVAFDEFPGTAFLTEYSSGDANQIVSRFLSKQSGLPFSQWADLDGPHSSESVAAADCWVKQERRAERTYRNSDSSADAALLTQAMLQWRVLGTGRLGNGWRYADLGNEHTAVQHPSGGQVFVLTPPVLENASSVIALDGTPSVNQWRVLLGETLEHRRVLTESEANEYLRDVLGLRIIQTSPAIKPYSGGQSVRAKRDLTYLEAIAKREGARPVLITSKKAKEKYCKYGVETAVAGCAHYGNLIGVNTFAQTRFGVIIGCPQPSDRTVELWAALAGVSVKPKTDADGMRLKGQALDFGPHGNDILHGERENQVLQAVMRFGRTDGPNGEHGATVYVHTCALPEWVEREELFAEVTLLDAKRGGFRQVVEAIQSLDNWQNGRWSKQDVLDAVRANADEPIGERQVEKHLKKLHESGFVGGERVRARGRPWQWWNVSLEEVGRYGVVRFPSDEQTNSGFTELPRTKSIRSSSETPTKAEQSSG